MHIICIVLSLPGTFKRPRHFLAGRTVAATDAAFIKAFVGADDTITSGFDALALNANGGRVWAAGRPVGHLEGKDI